MVCNAKQAYYSVAWAKIGSTSFEGNVLCHLIKHKFENELEKKMKVTTMSFKLLSKTVDAQHTQHNAQTSDTERICVGRSNRTYDHSFEKFSWDKDYFKDGLIYPDQYLEW